MAIPVLKRLLLFSTHKHKPLSFSSQPSDQSETLISTVVSILTQQRSKSRWGNLQSLYPKGFHPNDFSEIALQLKNNPHLALRFFLWTQHKSLCHHNLLTYSTTIHILTRARLLTKAHSLIRTAIRIPQQHNLEPKPLMLFQSLVMTYRVLKLMELTVILSVYCDAVCLLHKLLIVSVHNVLAVIKLLVA